MKAEIAKLQAQLRDQQATFEENGMMLMGCVLVAITIARGG